MEYQVSQESYLAFSSFLHKKLGIVLGDKKQYLVRSRLSAIAREYQYTDMDLFLKDIVNIKHRALTDKCLELMTTNETFWFRDAYPFALLEQHILPDLYKQQKKLRIWSAACASGQEPYSIAMTVHEFMRHHSNAFSHGVEIVATDFSNKMIEFAQAGIYDELAIARGLPTEMRQRYFTSTSKNGMQVKANLSSMVKFMRYNLLQEFSSLGHFDIVFCRNVLIYFDGNQKQEILKKIAACLSPAGSLFLGAAESISGAENLFKMKSIDKGLYFSKI